MDFPCPIELGSKVEGQMTLVASDDIYELSCNHNNCPLYPYRHGTCTAFLPCPNHEGFNTSYPIKKGSNVVFNYALEATPKLFNTVVSAI